MENKLLKGIKTTKAEQRGTEFVINPDMANIKPTEEPIEEQIKLIAAKRKTKKKMEEI